MINLSSRSSTHSSFPHPSHPHPLIALPCPYGFSGATVLHDVLSNSLPDSFFPGPMPCSTGDGHTVQVLASVQVRRSTAALRSHSLEVQVTDMVLKWLLPDEQASWLCNWLAVSPFLCDAQCYRRILTRKGHMNHRPPHNTHFGVFHQLVLPPHHQGLKMIHGLGVFRYQGFR